jgi:type III pantothenate kinase
MKNLIIDFGNTLQKLATFSKKDILAHASFHNIQENGIRKYLSENGPYKKGILSSVIDVPHSVCTLFKSEMELLEMSHTLNFPFTIDYQTPDTLGKDRLALAAGAVSRYPGENVLVISAGTAITYDFVSENRYLGGAISPGLTIRFRALHTFTDKLPFIDINGPLDLVGKSTEGSIRSGVVNGTIEEIDGTIQRYQEKFGNLRAIITGGDHNYLAGKLKSDIFAHPNLLLEGLNEILQLNA